MEINVLNINGQETGRKVSLNESIYGIEPNDHVIYLDVKQYLADQRQGTAKAKERSEHAGSTRKLGRQKGGGGARHGDINSPLLRGGGRVFGPKPRDYSFKLNKKVKVLARKSALSYKVQDNALVVVEDFNLDAPKTKDFVNITKNLKVEDKKVLLLLPESNKNVYLSARNLQRAEVLEASKVNENRGMEMYRVGSLSKAALSQLTSQRAQDEYNLVQSESNVRNYKRQLKALLQITDEEEFDVVETQATESMALQPIPSVQSVYEAAVENRPEIKRARLSVESANIQRRIATAQYLPTVTLNASATSNHSSQNNNAWGTQLKNGFNVGGGFSVNVPIFDRREARTAVNKANIQKQQALLDIRDKETTLYSTISDFWIQAYNNQQQYKSAKVSTESAQTSYDLLSEQFQVGLKNIVELQEGKTRLLTAQQSELQAKYTTIYCIKMLEFYKK